jgi:hypothetical protein
MRACRMSLKLPTLEVDEEEEFAVSSLVELLVPSRLAREDAADEVCPE